MLRYPHSDTCGAPRTLSPAEAARRPVQAGGSDADGFAEWMAHVDAGRIAVR
jgi:hypothetical protein